jgi:hypothetical protein
MFTNNILCPAKNLNHLDFIGYSMFAGLYRAYLAEAQRIGK